jgi:hypothetical protein
MVTRHRPLTQAEILLDVVAGGKEALPSEVASWLLTLEFSEEQQKRMLDLAERGNAGTLSEAEKAEVHAYAQAGNLLTLWHAKARLALRSVSQTA